MTYFIGIDPGQAGGIAVLRDENVEWLRSMPETETDVWSLVDDLPIGRAYIEKVHSRPGQSSVATFKFGRNYGFIRGCLIAAEIPFEEVTPQAWQKFLEIPKRNGEHEKQHQFKTRLRNIAQQMFPGTHITLKTGDALLIAEYCRRKHSRPSAPTRKTFFPKG